MPETATAWIPYCGSAPEPGHWLSRWNGDPVLLTLLAGGTLAWLCLRPREANRDTMAGGVLAAMLVLYVSPFCALGSALFATRAVHHIALAALLAPLVVGMFALHRRALPGPLAMWTALQALAFWVWHAPPIYAAALSSDALFWLMQLSIAGSAAIFWARMRQSPPPAAIAALLASMVQMGVLGALLTFAGRAFYAPHSLTTQAWGLTPLEDQQVGGLVMWAPGSAIYLLAAMVLLYRWLGFQGRPAGAR